MNWSDFDATFILTLFFHLQVRGHLINVTLMKEKMRLDKKK